MSKRLLILRHAQAEQPAAVQRDFERELTPTGFADALRLGQHLATRPGRPQAILASPAHRARTTAELVGEQLGLGAGQVTLDPELYDASAGKLLQRIQATNETIDCLVLVGHNPHLSYLAEYLTRQEVGELATCGVAAIDFALPAWADVAQGTGTLDWLLSPDTLTTP